MNYRHAFHAGNFADLVKHAGLMTLLKRLGPGAPLKVIDTHAGRGLYDLAGPEARKSGEAEAGIVRLMATGDAPAVFRPLIEAVRMLNRGEDVRRYPGSPLLIAGALRPQDRYVGFELRKEEHDALRSALGGRANALTRCADGFSGAAAEVPREGRTLLLIDPPFEKADDYPRIIETLAAARARNPGLVALVWLPLKDLETFDSFLRDLEDEIAEPMQVAEARIRPLADPMKMNGCALVLAGAPELESELAEICGWTARHLGDGGGARVYWLGSS